MTASFHYEAGGGGGGGGLIEVGYSATSVSTIFLIEFGAVPTVWYYFSFHKYSALRIFKCALYLTFPDSF